MSRHIKSETEQVKDYIYFLEPERNEMHYQIYVCNRRDKLYEYELTLRELDKQYDELERLEKKYKIELRKESYKCANEETKRICETLISQVQLLVDLENAKPVKRDELSMEIEHVEDTDTEDPIKELKEVEDKEVVCEDQVEETKPQLDCFQIVEEYKVTDEIIEVDHIDFVIPEYSIAPPSVASQFSEFFASQSSFKPEMFFFVLAQSCMVVLAFYKTRGHHEFSPTRGEDGERE